MYMYTFFFFFFSILWLCVNLPEALRYNIYQLSSVSDLSFYYMWRIFFLRHIVCESSLLYSVTAMGSMDTPHMMIYQLAETCQIFCSQYAVPLIF
jgi:hypothetical protein